MNSTAVIFRKDREGEIFALFPEVPADNYGRYCLAYQHVGQSCAADYRGCIQHSRPAAPNEYRELLTEVGKGFSTPLVVKQKATAVMHQERNYAARHID